MSDFLSAIETLQFDLDLAETPEQLAVFEQSLKAVEDTLDFDDSESYFHTDALRAALAARKSFLEARVVSAAAASAPVATPAPTPAAAPAPVETKADTRTRLLALIAGATTLDQLTDAVVPVVDKDSRKGDLYVVRLECREALKVKAKALGLSLDMKALDALMPRNTPTATGSTSVTETGVANRMLDLHGHELTYVMDSKEWRRFEGSAWTPVGVQVVHQMARDVVATLRRQALAIIDPEANAKAMAKVESAERTAFAKGATEGLACEESIRSVSGDFDATPHLLAVKNGVVDLQTGTLLPGSPELRLSNVTTVNYNPAATAPWFEQTVREAFGGNQELASFFKRLMGYAVLGTPTERLMVVAIGAGKNGKSTIFNAIQNALGSHATTMSSETIASAPNATQASAGGTRSDLVRLRNKRCVFSGEIKRHAVFNDETVKSLASGGDTITARTLFATEVEFKPTFTVIVPSNVLPHVRDDDPAIWDRLCLLPFGARFDTDRGGVEPDLQRPAKLAREAEGILAWLVAGALEYQRDGLQQPELTRNVKQSLRSSSSPFNVFLEDNTETFSGYVESSAALFTAWKEYAMLNNEKMANTSMAFSRTLASHGFESVRFSHKGVQVRGFKGLRLKQSQLRYTEDQPQLAI